jgi:hypothetical protein
VRVLPTDATGRIWGGGPRTRALRLLASASPSETHYRGCQRLHTDARNRSIANPPAKPTEAAALFRRATWSGFAGAFRSGTW